MKRFTLCNFVNQEKLLQISKEGGPSIISEPRPLFFNFQTFGVFLKKVYSFVISSIDSAPHFVPQICALFVPHLGHMGHTQKPNSSIFN